MKAANAGEAIELRVDEIAQLFDTLDPYPFPERDLDRNAEEYIVGWARELPRDRPFTIIVHFPDTDAQRMAFEALCSASKKYFAYRAGAVQRDLNELLRIGRRSLAIGAAILLACLLLAHLVAGFLREAPFNRLIEESLLILGWVANWRPLEIFLYDWWPLSRRRDLFRRLASAEMVARPYRPGIPHDDDIRRVQS